MLTVPKTPFVPDQAAKTQPSLLLLEGSQMKQELTNCGLQLVGLSLVFIWLMGKNVFHIFYPVEKIKRKKIFWHVKST